MNGEILGREAEFELDPHKISAKARFQDKARIARFCFKARIARIVRFCLKARIARIARFLL